jgi:hypothetical protein
MESRIEISEKQIAHGLLMHLAFHGHGKIVDDIMRFYVGREGPPFVRNMEFGGGSAKTV